MTDCGHKKVRDILCRRDGITPAEAQALINQTIEEIYACDGCYDDALDIMMDNLGLEGDYILDIL